MQSQGETAEAFAITVDEMPRCRRTTSHSPHEIVFADTMLDSDQEDGTTLFAMKKRADGIQRIGLNYQADECNVIEQPEQWRDLAGGIGGEGAVGNCKKKSSPFPLLLSKLALDTYESLLQQCMAAPRSFAPKYFSAGSWAFGDCR